MKWNRTGIKTVFRSIDDIVAVFGYRVMVELSCRELLSHGSTNLLEREDGCFSWGLSVVHI